MNESKFDLEERTYIFARDVRKFIKKLPNSVANREDGCQLVRSSGSVGANYIEANESVSKKDFLYRVKICKKESKETKHWLRMIARANPDKRDQCKKLWSEVQELTLIFSAILSSTKSPEKPPAGDTVEPGNLRSISQS